MKRKKRKSTFTTTTTTSLLLHNHFFLSSKEPLQNPYRASYILLVTYKGSERILRRQQDGTSRGRFFFKFPFLTLHLLHTSSCQSSLHYCFLLLFPYWSYSARRSKELMKSSPLYRTFPRLKFKNFSLTFSHKNTGLNWSILDEQSSNSNVFQKRKPKSRCSKNRTIPLNLTLICQGGYWK